MTSHFDSLDALGKHWVEGRIPPDLHADLRELVNAAVRDASETDPSWSFEQYLAIRGISEKGLDTFHRCELATRFKFLHDSHSILAHNSQHRHQIFTGRTLLRLKTLCRTLEQRGLVFA